MSAALPSWLAAEAVLGGGVLAGLIAAWACRGAGAAASGAEPADAALDLDEQLGAQVAQLRDLEAQRGRIEAGDFTAQHGAYSARAAALMRARDAAAARPQRRPPRPPPLSPAMAFFAARPALRGALWGGGTVGVLALLYVLAHDAQTPVVTPPGPPPAAAAATQVDPEELHRLTQSLQAHPDDVPTLVQLAHLLMRGQMLDEARRLNDRALALAPDHVEAQVHAAVFAAAAGDAQAGIARLETILRAQPEMAEAWFFRGMLSMQRGDAVTMRESLERFVELVPPGAQRDRIAAMLAAQQQ